MTAQGTPLSHRMCWHPTRPCPQYAVVTEPRSRSCPHAGPWLALHPRHRLSPCCHSVRHSLRWERLFLPWLWKAPCNQCHRKGVGCLIVFPPLTFLERGASSRQVLRSRTMGQEGWAHHLPLPGVLGGAGPTHSPVRCLA